MSNHGRWESDWKCANFIFGAACTRNDQQEEKNWQILKIRIINKIYPSITNSISAEVPKKLTLATGFSLFYHTTHRISIVTREASHLQCRILYAIAVEILPLKKRRPVRLANAQRMLNFAYLVSAESPPCDSIKLNQLYETEIFWNHVIFFTYSDSVRFGPVNKSFLLV